MPEPVKKVLFILIAGLCLTPYLDPPMALLAGLTFALTLKNPFANTTSQLTKKLLQYSVIGLGFGMNLLNALKAGREGFIFTICTIIGVFAAGFLIGKLFKVEKVISYLLSAGTAICGGSAIAAISPLINADNKQISVSMGIVFILNAIALFLFPVIGHELQLTQAQFGVWAAIAIHDTSSVVGAAAKYGHQALEMATTIKLERALWMIPLAIFTSIVFHSRGKKIKIPFFIFGFIAAMLVSFLFPAMHVVSESIYMVAKKGLTLTLFLIGAGMSYQNIKNVGLRPFILGLILWIAISVGSLAVIMKTV